MSLSTLPHLSSSALAAPSADPNIILGIPFFPTADASTAQWATSGFAYVIYAALVLLFISFFICYKQVSKVPVTKLERSDFQNAPIVPYDPNDYIRDQPIIADPTPVPVSRTIARNRSSTMGRNESGNDNNARVDYEMSQPRRVDYEMSSPRRVEYEESSPLENLSYSERPMERSATVKKQAQYSPF